MRYESIVYGYKKCNLLPLPYQVQVYGVADSCYNGTMYNLGERNQASKEVKSWSIYTSIANQNCGIRCSSQPSEGGMMPPIRQPRPSNSSSIVGNLPSLPKLTSRI